MKKIVIPVICFLLIVDIHAQNKAKSFSIEPYCGIEMAAYMHLDIPDIAVSFGMDRPAKFAPLVTFGYQMNFPRWLFSIGGELGGLFNEKISSVVGGCNLFGGYHLNNSLTLGISCGVQAYRCYAGNGSTAYMDIENGSIAGSSSAWDLANVQKLTVGPCVKYKVDNTSFMVGADFGLIPAEYESRLYNINNNRTTTFHRLYVGFQTSVE